jgi:stringent starvation protein B
MTEASTKPYLIRAIHEWCADNGFTPYVAVAVDEHTQVPREHVRNGEIVLNVSMAATNSLQLGNDFVAFQARFNGQVREIMIPVSNITAIYARENGHGMSFDVPKALAIAPTPKASSEASGDLPSDAAKEASVPQVGRPPKLAPVPSQPPKEPVLKEVKELQGSADAPADEPPPNAPTTPAGGSKSGKPKLTRVK